MYSTPCPIPAVLSSGMSGCVSIKRICVVVAELVFLDKFEGLTGK